MSIFLCSAVATRSAFGQHSANAQVQSEQDMFEAKGYELSRQARRGRTSPTTGLKAPLILKSLIVAPLAFVTAMTVNQALAAAAPQLDMVAVHTCSAPVQDINDVVIAQSGKVRTTADSELALVPALVSQQSKVREGVVPTVAVVSYVRCVQGTN